MKYTEKKLTLPLSSGDIDGLCEGDIVLLSGKLYSARDCAHKRLFADSKEGKLPVDLKNAAIYYAGPCPAKPNEIIGSCGPTTSKRMDGLTPFILSSGVRVLIGKGERSEEVKKAIKACNAVYFQAIGGAGALYASCVKSCILLAYPELLSEAIYELNVENFPVVVSVKR